VADWQERITNDTAPAIRIEHQLRYSLVAPLIASSATWVELGCGTGVAARAALGALRPGHTILVDLDDSAVTSAAAELGIADARLLAADLADANSLTRIGTELMASDAPRVVTCFEVVEHLRTFVPLLEWAAALARDGAVTLVMSVPNDAYWSIQNPYHETTWGQGAFDELCRLLPADRTLLRQVELTGSGFVDWDESGERHRLEVQLGGAGTVPTHFIAAIGPRHSELQRAALAVQTETAERRRWERQRESNLAIAEARVRELGAALKEREEVLAGHGAEFEAWRKYIHELERELGRPLSGIEDPAARGE
jgi:hypothetical protein